MGRVDVNLISTVGRIRKVSEAQVKALAESIAEVGLLNPVSVYRKTILRAGVETEGYGLVAGAHRLEACKRLGLADIEAVVLDLDELHRTIAECDENLCGTQLSLAERAEFTARRKWAYDELHPEARLASASRGSRFSAPTETHSVGSFATETAERTGKSERSVFKDVERGTKICNTALDKIKGTRLDTARYLDGLKDLPVAAQIRRVDADLAAGKPTTTPRSDDDFDRLMGAWERASISTRSRFLTAIQNKGAA